MPPVPRTAMVGAHMGAQHLQRYGGGALACGINMMLAERTSAATQVAGMLTLDGRCKTLDAAADGYVRAEACVVLHLLAHEAGEAGAGSPLAPGTALLRGTFVNQDGRSSSLTAPNGPAQQAVLRGALAAAALAPAQLMGLEMHGTGTPLGDPIEVGAATAVLAGAPTRLRLSAAKSRMGHAEPAAGSVGMVQAMVQMGMQRSNAIMHLRALNPYVSSTLAELAASQAGPILPRQDAAAVTAPLGLAAGPGAVLLAAMGISAFAFQGTNAHVVLAATSSSDAQLLASDAGLDASLWQRQRHWYTVPLHRMLHACSVSATLGTLVVHSHLAHAALGFLLDHQVRRGACAHLPSPAHTPAPEPPRHAVSTQMLVQIQGRPLFPAAGMLEMALATALAAQQAQTTERLALTGTAIAAPLVLGKPTHRDHVASCCLHYATGALEVTSGRPASTTHMRTQAGVWVRCGACNQCVILLPASRQTSSRPRQAWSLLWRPSPRPQARCSSACSRRLSLRQQTRCAPRCLRCCPRPAAWQRPHHLWPWGCCMPRQPWPGSSLRDT